VRSTKIRRGMKGFDNVVGAGTGESDGGRDKYAGAGMAKSGSFMYAVCANSHLSQGGGDGGEEREVGDNLRCNWDCALKCRN
jgi:hypothetical protein